MQKSNQIIPLHVVKLLLQKEAQKMQLCPSKVFPTLCSNSRFTVCFSSSTAIKGENSAQCSLTWKKVNVERYPFSENRFPKIFKTPSPLLLLPPLLTSQSNQVDSPPPCSYISMTKYAKYRTLFHKIGGNFSPKSVCRSFSQLPVTHYWPTNALSRG